MYHDPTHCSTCAHCGSFLDPDAAYWLFITSDRPLPMCAECARWHTEGFFPVPFILEAQLIIIDAHQRLNAREVLR